MRAKLALKLAILAVLALGFLSGCFLFTNSATIAFDNYVAASFDCYVDGAYVGTVGSLGYPTHEYTWTGASTRSFYWEVDGSYYSSGYLDAIDGQISTVLIN